MKEIPQPIKIRFCDALLASCFGNRNTRDTILTGFADIENKANRRDNNLDDVTEIVTVALGRPNGIVWLVDAIHYREKNTEEMKRIWEMSPWFVFRNGDEPITLERIGELLVILSDIDYGDNPVIEKCCRGSLPSGFEGLGKFPARLEMIHAIFTHGQAKSRTLPEFVNRMAKERKNLDKRLRQWASDCGLPKPVMKERRYHLWVIVEEDWKKQSDTDDQKDPIINARLAIGSDDGHWDVGAPKWTWPENIGEEKRNETHIKDGCLTCRLSDLKPFVEAYLVNLPGEVGENLDAVEFAVPDKQLFLKTDCWRYSEKKRIGQVFQVLMKMRRRLYGNPRSRTKFIGTWKEKWGRHQAEKLNPAGENTVWMFDSPNWCEDMISNTCDSDEKTVLAMAFRSGKREHEKGFAEEFYESGVPVALIYRKPDSHDREIGEAEKLFRKMLSAPLADLPNQVKKARQERPEFREHLTLIRDSHDPDSMPELTF